MAEKIITHLHLSCFLWTAEVCIHVLRDTYSTGQKCTEWELHKFLNGFFRKITWIKRYWIITGPFLSRKTFQYFLYEKSKKAAVLLLHKAANHWYWKILSES